MSDIPINIVITHIIKLVHVRYSHIHMKCTRCAKWATLMGINPSMMQPLDNPSLIGCLDNFCLNILMYAAASRENGHFNNLTWSLLINHRKSMLWFFNLTKKYSSGWLPRLIHSSISFSFRL